MPFVPSGQAQTVKPLLHIRFAGTGTETHSFEPIPGTRQLRQQFSAFAKPRAGGRTEGDYGLSGKIVCFYKAIHRPCGNAPPNGILKCSPSSPALENTGLNGLHKCVFCSFLVAYCSDLSHLLYSGLPVYTNTYI